MFDNRTDVGDEDIEKRDDNAVPAESNTGNNLLLQGDAGNSDSSETSPEEHMKHLAGDNQYSSQLTLSSHCPVTN